MNGSNLKAERASTVVLLAMVLLMGATCCGSVRILTGQQRSGPGRVTVDRVVDGDTVDLHFPSGTERVRLLGSDTPETVKPNSPIQCFGPEASARTKALLPHGMAVRVERDTEARDRYGRLLLYVYRSIDGMFVNRALVIEGYARILSITPNTAHAPDLATAAASADRAGRGLWSQCGTPTNPP